MRSGDESVCLGGEVSVCVRKVKVIPSKRTMIKGSNRHNGPTHQTCFRVVYLCWLVVMPECGFELCPFVGLCPKQLFEANVAAPAVAPVASVVAGTVLVVVVVFLAVLVIPASIVAAPVPSASRPSGAPVFFHSLFVVMTTLLLFLFVFSVLTLALICLAFLNALRRLILGYLRSKPARASHAWKPNANS